MNIRILFNNQIMWYLPVEPQVMPMNPSIRVLEQLWVWLYNYIFLFLPLWAVKFNLVSNMSLICPKNQINQASWVINWLTLILIYPRNQMKQNKKLMKLEVGSNWAHSGAYANINYAWCQNSGRNTRNKS